MPTPDAALLPPAPAAVLALDAAAGAPLAVPAGKGVSLSQLLAGVAAAVAASDRCLVVGDQSVSSATSAARVIELASRVGVPRTRMSAVFNRFGARGADEDVAMRFEITCALSSKIRIADGGQDLTALMAFGRADEAVGQTSAFATSVREATREMLVELGCAVGPWNDMVTDRATRTERPRIRLPWSREGDSR